MTMQRFSVGLLLFMLLTTGCGNRGTPAIKQELLDQKLSVLMLTSASLSDSAKSAVGSSLQKWREGNLIAYDWMKDLNTLDDSVIKKLKMNAYDYIYVIGNELLAPADQLISQHVTAGKWSLLQNEIDESAQITQDAQASIFQIDPSRIDSLNTKWVKDLLAQNVSVEWVTLSDHPVPSQLAPSEEADHIVLLDHNDQWFQQLSFQTKQHFSKWIIFYARTDASLVQKAKSIGIPVMDLSNSLSAELDWEKILDNQLDGMLKHTWRSGETNYNEQELKELKIK